MAIAGNRSTSLAHFPEAMTAIANKDRYREDERAIEKPIAMGSNRTGQNQLSRRAVANALCIVRCFPMFVAAATRAQVGHSRKAATAQFGRVRPVTDWFIF